MGSLIVLPAKEPRLVEHRDEFLSRPLATVDLAPAAGPDEALSARLCAALLLLDPPAPVTVVAFGSLALVLPAIALALRTSHRRVAGYVLVEPSIPPGSDGWPDAPVEVFSDSPHPQVLLRGWACAPLADLRHWQPAP